MTRPHTVEGKARTAGAIEADLLKLIPCHDNDHAAKDCPKRRAVVLLAELRRSLRDTRGKR